MEEEEWARERGGVSVREKLGGAEEEEEVEEGAVLSFTLAAFGWRMSFFEAEGG